MNREYVETGGKVAQKRPGRLIDNDAALRYEQTQLKQQQVRDAEFVPAQPGNPSGRAVAEARVALHEPKRSMRVEQEAHSDGPHSGSGSVGWSISSAEGASDSSRVSASRFGVPIEDDRPLLIDVVAEGRTVDRGVPKNIDHEGRGRLVVQPSGQLRDRLSIQLAAENTDVHV
jgi:hypothetical protein